MAVKFYVPMPSKKYKFLIKKKRPSWVHRIDDGETKKKSINLRLKK
jgi:hypothetical protein